MKKLYAEPEFDMIRMNFQRIMDGDDPDHGIVHSIGEGNAVGGGEGED